MFPIFKAALPPLWAISGALLVLGALQVRAQAQATPASPGAASARADPADPKAPVPAALYLSPLRGYQRFAEPQVAPWRETNERVRQRGGWRSYAREASEPDTTPATAPAASQPAAAAKPASGGHSGHEMK